MKSNWQNSITFLDRQVCGSFGYYLAYLQWKFMSNLSLFSMTWDHIWKWKLRALNQGTWSTWFYACVWVVQIIKFGLLFLRACSCHPQVVYETSNFSILNCLCGQLKLTELAIKGLYPNYVKWILASVTWSCLPACLLELVIPSRCCSPVLGISLPLKKETQVT